MAKASKAKHILVITDWFTKFVVSTPLVGTESEDGARAIVEKWVLKFGVPDVLHTDQGKNFGNQLILDMCRLLKIDKTRTSPYHPQGNGQVERHNRILADVISKFCADNPWTLDEMLPYVDFVFNTTVHRTTEATPFSLVFGQECQYPIDVFYPKPPDEERSQGEFIEWLEAQFCEAHANAREQLGVNQQRQKDLYFKKVYGEPYEIGANVWLYSKQKAKSKKFLVPYEGPYIIQERTSEVNYMICKEGRPRKTRIVHFNLLKPYNEERTGDRSGRNKRPTLFRSQDFFNRFPDDQVEEYDDDGEVMRNTENTLHERQQCRRNIAAAQVRLRDARLNKPSVSLVEAEQISSSCNLAEVVDMLADITQCPS